MRLRRGQVCVAEGFGIRIRVSRQHLVIDDGIGRNRRTRTYARATHGLSRLIVIGNDGYVTLGAIRWLTNLGIGYLHLDRDGHILASTETGSGDARLRRLQAHSATSPVGVEIARHLLAVKVDGQARNLDLIPGDRLGRGPIGYWQERIRDGTTLDELLEAEREAAAAYWNCWAGLQLRFAPRDLDRIPDHWQRIGTRHSPLSNGPRVAITPTNAILNYLYAILEAETRVACLVLGLDPGLGVWHADYRSRDSFALDVMEAARPDVDKYVLELIGRRAFTRKDVGETSRGICRLLPALSEELAQTAGQWREAVGPHVEKVAELLARMEGSRVAELPTPLTRKHRARGQDHRRRSPRVRATDARSTTACKRCGDAVPRHERVYCDTCFALPQADRRVPTRRTASRSEAGVRSSRTCKSCGDSVPHRKRVYCDTCFAEYEASLKSARRACRRCALPVPNRKRVYCDVCLAHLREGPSGSVRSMAEPNLPARSQG